MITAHHLDYCIKRMITAHHLEPRAEHEGWVAAEQLIYVRQ